MKFRLLLACCWVACVPFVSIAEDWPMWRHGAGRSGVASSPVPDKMEVLWTRELPPLTPAFHTPRLQFDAGYEPIVAGGNLLLGSSLTDSVTAYDVRSGEVKWTYRTNGPVRFAPAVWQNSVCFGSDDGYLYCVDLASGKLRWKLQAVPSNRRVLGNRRLVSMWPVRGGPVVEAGRVYFAAGVWPFEGVFVFCMDIDSGKVLWRNDRLGYLFGTQPHATQAIGGLAPQGYLVINGDELVVPCSTAYPARLDKNSGVLVDFELPSPGRFPGGWFAAIDPAQAKAIRRGQLTFDDVVNRQEHEDRVHKGKGTSGVSRMVRLGETTWDFDEPIAGVEGTIHSIAAADGLLFVTTREGRLYCLGERTADKPVSSRQWAQEERSVLQELKTPPRARGVLGSVKSRYGLAIVVGLEDGALLKSLLVNTHYHVVAFDDGQERVDRLRDELMAAGLYGTRAAIVHCDLDAVELPPYIATVLTTERRALALAKWKPLLQSLRPFGGVAALGFTHSEYGAAGLNEISPGGFAFEMNDGEQLVVRRGRLPGSTDYAGGWQANSDRLVRFPLGVVWFDDTLAHFKRSPQPRFVDGVMISQPKDWHASRKPGNNRIDYPLLPHVLSDIYTGRVLADEEALEVRQSLVRYDSDERGPSQYRPPGQKNAWKPEQPIAGRRVNPLTGDSEPRAFPKTYGCDGGVDYGDIYTMRSGTPAFYDKTLESGTVFLSGPRSGCTNSIIPSGGLMNVPYFYEGCTCSYPLPTAMALVTMPESHEQWASWGHSKLAANSVRRVGLNFGAPGDRMTREGTLWLDYPSVGGPSPDIVAAHAPQSSTFRYRHSLWMEGGEGERWVTASCAEGLRNFTISDLKPGSYSVRLLFAEPHASAPGQRVQDVFVQDARVLSQLDVYKETGGTMRGLVKKLEAIQVVDGTMTLQLVPSAGQTLISGMEIVRSAHGAGDATP